MEASAHANLVKHEGFCIKFEALRPSAVAAVAAVDLRRFGLPLR